MIQRRSVLAGGAAAAAAALVPRAGRAATPGVTAHTIKIGNTNPYSGPASSYGVIGHTLAAYFKMMNDKGGVAGHKIDFISYDDSYSPPKTVEDVRRLVEQDHVDFLFQTLGTPCNTAIVEYCQHHKIPQLFVATGASKWGDYKKYPWTIGFQPTYRAEAQIYAKYILKTKPDAKVAVLSQNDDYGKDYLNGLHDIFGKDWSKHVVKALTYEVTDPTVTSQMTQLKSSGADTFICIAVPKQAAQAIDDAANLKWKPEFFLNSVASSVGATMNPAGPKNCIGIVTAGWVKDPTEPTWKNDPGMNEWRTFMKKYMPKADMSDVFYTYAYAAGNVMRYVLEQCKGDFSRKNVLDHAINIKELKLGTLLPGIIVHCTPTDRYPVKSMQLMRFNGKTWVRFGGIITGV